MRRPPCHVLSIVPVRSTECAFQPWSIAVREPEFLYYGLVSVFMSSCAHGMSLCVYLSMCIYIYIISMCMYMVVAIFCTWPMSGLTDAG